MQKLVIRCSSLFKLMSNPTGKTNLEKYEATVNSLEESRIKYEAVTNKETKTALKLHAKIIDLKALAVEQKRVKDVVILSQTCKTWLKEEAKQFFYGYNSEIKSKYFEKGHKNEDAAIVLLNEKLGTTFIKNEERKTNGWLTGECDLNDVKNKTIRDIKNAWSLETFPAFKEDVDKKADESGYIWQQKGYLILWKYKRAFVDYCFTETPDNLLSVFDNKTVHKYNPKIKNVKYITPSSEIVLEDGEEAEIKRRHKYAQIYYNELINELKAK